MVKAAASAPHPQTHFLPTHAAARAGVDRKTVRRWIKSKILSLDSKGLVNLNDLTALKSRPRRGRPHGKKTSTELPSPERIGKHIALHPLGNNYLRSILWHARNAAKNRRLDDFAQKIYDAVVEETSNPIQSSRPSRQHARSEDGSRF